MYACPDVFARIYNLLLTKLFCFSQLHLSSPFLGVFCRHETDVCHPCHSQFLFNGQGQPGERLYFVNCTWKTNNGRLVPVCFCSYTGFVNFSKFVGISRSKTFEIQYSENRKRVLLLILEFGFADAVNINVLSPVALCFIMKKKNFNGECV